MNNIFYYGALAGLFTALIFVVYKLKKVNKESADRWLELSIAAVDRESKKRRDNPDYADAFNIVFPHVNALRSVQRGNQSRITEILADMIVDLEKNKKKASNGNPIGAQNGT